MGQMLKTKFGLVSCTEARWLADKKKRERHAKKHGDFNLHKGGGDHAKGKTM